MQVLRLDEQHRPQINQLLVEGWSGPIIVSRGVAHDTSNMDGFVALSDGMLAGYVLFNVVGADCEVIVLQSIENNCGYGTALLNSVERIACERGCSRMWLVTTNDNTHALRFYQRYGFDLTAVYINALDKARLLKPSIPLVGDNDIPLKHEFVFSKNL